MSLLYWGSWLERDSDMVIISVRTPLKDGPLEKLWGGGVGNFRAAGTFFRYQIPCVNFF